MYLLKTPATRTDPEELNLMAEPNEIADLFVTAMAEAQDLVHTVHAIDDYTDEPIELDIEDYFIPEIEDLLWGEVTEEMIRSCAR